MSWGIRVEGKRVMRRRHKSLGGSAPEFVIGFFSEQQDKPNPRFVSTPEADSLIEHRANLKNRLVGEITVELSQNNEIGTFEYTEPLLVQPGKGFSSILLLRAAEELHQKVPELKEIQLETQRISIRDVIAHYRGLIEKNTFRFGKVRRQMSRERRREVRKRILTRRH